MPQLVPNRRRKKVAAQQIDDAVINLLRESKTLLFVSGRITFRAVEGNTVSDDRKNKDNLGHADATMVQSDLCSREE